jgi:acetyl-CoA synthetase
METSMTATAAPQGTEQQGPVESRVFAPPAQFTAQATVSGMEAYQALCDEAARDYEGFWARLARENIEWQTPFTRTLNEDDAPFYKWFDDGKLNASYNCLDRNLANGNADKAAIIFEADDGAVTRVTYRELHEKVGKFANGLKSLGIKKGDRVVIYMPMSIEGIVAMQACARIGATHSVVFGGFSSKSLNERIIDVGAVALITADEQMRGGKRLPLKNIADEALAMGGCETVKERRSSTAHGRQGRWRKGATCGCTRSSKAERRLRAGMGRCASIRCSSCIRRVRRARRRACSTRPAATCCGPRRP